MIITSVRRRGDLRIELKGDDGKNYHFMNAENAANWMKTNTTNNPTLTSIAPVTAVAGAPNTTVTLTGTNFNANTEVLVNNSPVAKTYVSPTSITTVLATSTMVGANVLQVSARNNGVFQTASKPFTVTVAAE
jgi:hypothetical protein